MTALLQRCVPLLVQARRPLEAGMVAKEVLGDGKVKRRIRSHQKEWKFAATGVKATSHRTAQVNDSHSKCQDTLAQAAAKMSLPQLRTVTTWTQCGRCFKKTVAFRS
jgi:hypothetical protein